MPGSLAEESLGLWSELLIKDKLFVNVRLHLVLCIHLLSFVDEADVLDLTLIEADLATECVRVARIVLEQDNRGPILVGRHVLGSLPGESTVDLLSIYLQLKLVDATRWRLRVIPESQGGKSDRLFKEEDDVVGFTLLGLIFVSGGGGVCVPLSVLIWSQPDVIVV